MIKLIGAGFARTGTMSLRTALARLGYHAYHMEEAAMNYERGDLAAWNAYMDGKGDMDWYKLLAEYDATTDFPACLYYRELMTAFPDARVILTVRDPEKWWLSWEKLSHWHDTVIERLTFLPRFRLFQRLERNIERVVFGGVIERENCTARFNQHNEAVKATVPPDRLLVFEVKEGWEPLCKFLGVPVPDEPFPHVNEGIATVDQKARAALINDFRKIALPVLAAAAAIIVAIYLLIRFVFR